MDTRILIKECQSLQKAGHEVVYIVPNAEDAEHFGVKIKGVTSIAKNRLKRMMNTTSLVFEEALRQDADVYHFHDPELMPIGLKLKGKGKKVIYDVHEDLPEQVLSKQWIPTPFRKSVAYGAKSFERYASKRFDAVVTATPYINERFKTYNPNTVTIHNYPLLQELMKGMDSAETASPTENKQRSVVYLGGIYLLRGIKEMISSVEKVNEKLPVTFRLGGSFAPASLEDEVKKMSGWKYVNYLGFLNRQEVKEELSHADAGLVLLHPEPRFVVSYPIKLFEYMSAGLPVIASNFPLWEEIVSANECGICVDPLNIEEIAKAIQTILDNPEKAAEMGKNGRRAIEEKYNWEKESERLIELYERLS
ncbi:glycosyltransferase family 4 protein [Fictibacillus barbaricus]|uniref:Glycosyltransferase involved in cell wall biosynthesis n=1 Tax=Fictibacillus barbaricus TaxID=182136 RepID=A0ABU1U136_9BACL|nr:glycosyltransferase family 4 protein [Fictibacillus barbaricus]MDR7073173.1 glycosyltransferase involved in cell wall biosynthesis [Fictibacillus barbaricus]